MKKNNKKISIKNLPSGVTQEEIDEIVKRYSNVKTHELVNAGAEKLLEITFDSDTAAFKALEDVKNLTYKNTLLQAAYAESKGAQKDASKNANKPFLQRIPLRMLVSTQYVGAIIGKKGACVRNIATKCKARIDVHSKDVLAGVEKVISIYGQPEARSEACRQVLQLLLAEGAFPGKSEVVLRLLARDEFSGRLIGKEGRHIRQVRQLSHAQINIVLSHELSSMHTERVVMVWGKLQDVAAAEALISKKLTACYEADAAKAQALLTSSVFMRGRSTSMLSAFFPPSMPQKLSAAPAGVYPGSHFAYGDGLQQPVLPPALSDDLLHVVVPSTAVGALIGTGGVIIKHMMRSSGAFISIEKKEEKVDGDDERVVCIRGAAEACCRALFLVFERMRLEGFSGPSESRLKVVVAVPAEVVGRLIGKAGSHIRTLQKLSGAIIRVATPLAKSASASVAATDPATTALTVSDVSNDNVAAKGDNNEEKMKEEKRKEDKRQEGDGRTGKQADVQLFGNFSTVLNAHMRIKSFVQASTLDSLSKLNNNNNNTHAYHNRVYYNNNLNNNAAKSARNKKVN